PVPRHCGLYGPEDSERLVHLLAAHHDHAAVQPVFHEGRHAGVRLRLGYLRLVMREQEFGRAAVEIVLRAEVPDRDRRVLDVPSWPAFPQGLSQAGSPGFCARQRTKSAGCRFRSSISTLAPGRSSSTFCPLSLPHPEKVVVSKYTLLSSAT